MSCKGGWEAIKRQSMGGADGDLIMEDTAWAGRKQWLLGPVDLTQSQETGLYQLCLC